MHAFRKPQRQRAELCALTDTRLEPIMQFVCRALDKNKDKPLFAIRITKEPGFSQNDLIHFYV